MHVPIVSNTFQGSTVFSFSHNPEHTGRAPKCQHSAIGRHHMVVTLVQPLPRSCILFEGAICGRVLFLFPHRAGEGIHVYIASPAVYEAWQRRADSPGETQYIFSFHSHLFNLFLLYSKVL